MSEAAFAQSQELRGLLLPLTDGNLLLPNAIVVEVLSYPELTLPAEDSPDWLLGRFDWRSLSLPLIAYEHLWGNEVTAATQQRKRVAVCHLLSSGKAGSFVGLQTSGLPQLITVTERDLQVEDNDAKPESCVLADVLLHDIKTRIPDLNALKKLLISL